MSDTYQAVYDAVRSRIGGGNLSDALESAIRSENIGGYAQNAFDGIAQTFADYNMPSVMFKPVLIQDGDSWLAIYGDLPTGVVGSGKSPAEAMADFDVQWFKAAVVPQKKTN
ncbi:TPA: hypothetical protein ACPZAW_000686 [Yersinia enterocolitica]|uniref:hypothetical protein n=1 Tax=Yersinia TaxID=629 RepID=UPI000C14B94D|nr:MULTISPECIES: hypothetical protein [Yersinia]ELX2277069.1 hypothetical protein [Yersinia enterocolitica]EKN4704210.1 hypothetical protein [Yersinia ruckeri]PHZ22222.1 hypothetical protein CS535_18135 [Yersinia massiliensis]UIN06507.1 hypothetical protein LGL88_12215 [Yersinia ruckeri]HDL7204351.1 hypothetical protein [Yersinia enterocolitica]